MDSANLYLDDIDLGRYLTTAECRKCGAESCKDLVEKLVERGLDLPDLAGVASEKRRVLEAVADMKEVLPGVPKSPNPRPGPLGLTPLNKPVDGDPILVTGNNVFTQEVLMTVLSTTSKPLFFLSSDTRGDTLDMAVILGTFTADTVQNAFEAEGLIENARTSPLLIPGHAAKFAESIGAATGRQVDVGPVCAAELPLFYGEAVEDHGTIDRPRRIQEHAPD